MNSSLSYAPFVSVILPVRNGQTTIEACLVSLLAQEFPRDRYEVVVIDDDSQDGTINIVRNFPVRLYSETLHSADAARNTGILHARGKIIAFIDADCVADPRWLGFLTRRFSSEAVIGVAGKTLAYPADNLVVEFYENSLQPHRIRPDPTEPLAVPTPNIAYRRDVLLEVGLFNGSIPGAGVGDVDLSWRIQVYTGKRILYEPDAVILHKYETTLSGLYKQYRRYGFNEIILATLHKGKPYHARTPKYQLRRVLSQSRAAVMYILSAAYRFASWPCHKKDKRYVLSPLLQLIAETGDIHGKLQGCVATKGFQYYPFEQDH